MRTSCTGLMFLTALLLSGCVTNHYEVVMTPDGEKLHRELIAWQTTSGQDGENLTAMDQSELELIARVYGTPLPVAADQKHRFEGTFDGRTPGDVGGAGTLTVWPSRLGATSCYIERFRGSNDLNDSLAKRHAAANDLVDALLVWSEGELGGTGEGAKVNRFLETRLRDDLKNLATWLWVARAVSDAGGGNEGNEEVIAGMLQFLFEREYLTPDDLPAISRMRSGPDPDFLLAFVRRLLAQQTGVDEEKFEFLADTDRLQSSINEHLKDVPAVRTFLEEADDETKKPTDYLASLVVKIVAPALFSGGDQLDVVLRCPVEPFRTNGEWSDEEGAVNWSERLARRNEEPSGVLPVLLYASWSIPDEAFQREHFGSVILTGQPLGEYCLWRNSLNEQQAEEWDTFVMSLRPDGNLTERIANFRFSTDPPSEEAAATAAQQGRDLLLIFLADAIERAEENGAPQ